MPLGLGLCVALGGPGAVLCAAGTLGRPNAVSTNTSPCFFDLFRIMRPT